ncbi:MAG: hypothetical protein ACFFDI_27555, partial [Promethearchaeota archaeon]
TEEELTVLEYVEDLPLNTITGYQELLLDNRTLNYLLEKRSCPSRYTLHWNVQVFESNFSLLNTSSFIDSIPSWIDFVDHGGTTYSPYLTWWDPNETQYTETIGKASVLEYMQTSLTFNNTELPIKWVYAGYFYFHHGARFPVTPHNAGHRYKVSQLTFLNEDLELVCFAISYIFYYD